MLKDNRDILSFYLKIDPLIFQKKSRRRSPIQITGENVKNEGKKAKKYDLDEEETNQIDLPNPNILQQLIPSTMNPKNDASPIIDLNTNIVRKNLNHKVESTFPKKPNDAIVVDNRRKRIVESNLLKKDLKSNDNITTNVFNIGEEQIVNHKNGLNKNFFLDFKDSKGSHVNCDTLSEKVDGINDNELKEIPWKRINNPINGLKHFKFNFKNIDENQSEQSIDVNYDRKVSTISSIKNDSEKKMEKRPQYMDLSFASHQKEIQIEKEKAKPFEKVQLINRKVVNLIEDEEDKNKDKFIIKKCFVDLTKNEQDSKIENKDKFPVAEIKMNIRKESNKNINNNNKISSINEKVEILKNQNDFQCTTSCISLEIPSSIKSSKKANTDSSTTLHHKESSYGIKDYARFGLYFIVLTLSIFLIYLHVNNRGNLTRISTQDLILFPVVNLFSPNDILSRYWMYTILIIILYVLSKKWIDRFNHSNLAKKVFEKLKEELKVLYNEDNYENGMTEEQIITIYSSENNVSQDHFRINIFPLLKELRKKSSNIREFERQEGGKFKRVWQWSG